MKNTYFPIYQDHITNQCLKNNLDIDITPYTQCNLNCPFCEVSSMHSNYDPAWFQWSIEALQHLIPNSNAKSISIAIAGGELMHDRLFDYQLWDQWFNELKSIINDRPHKIAFITNLITHKIDQLIQLHQKYQFGIGTSFDFEGRFTKQKQVDLFVNNLKKLTAAGIDVGIAMIIDKPNIDAIKDEHHWLQPTFRWLYTNYNIGLEQYTDSNNLPHYCVTDDQVVEFYKFVLINYPKIKGLEKYFDSKSHWHNCSKDTIDIKPFHVNWSCCDKQHQFAKMFSKFNCLTCDYLNRCAPTCPTDALTHEKCIDKIMYEYIETTEKFKNKINE